MGNSKNLRRITFLSGLLVLASVIGLNTRVSSQKKQNERPRTYEAATVKAVPPVVSRIKDLEISTVKLIDEGTPQAAVSIDVTNNRDAAVMALDFISGKNDYSGLRIDGLLQEDRAVEVIAAHTLKTFTWSLGEIMEGQTVVLAAAVFADGKEEGDKRSLDGIKIHRRHFQEKQRDAKAKNGGQ